MRVLYRDPSDETLAAAEVTGTTYYPEEEVLQFTGDNDFGVRVDQSTAEKLVRSLYLEGRVDVTAYESCNIEMEFDEDEEEDEEDFGDTIEDLLDQEDEGGFLPAPPDCLPQRQEIKKKMRRKNADISCVCFSGRAWNGCPVPETETPKDCGNAVYGNPAGPQCIECTG